MEGRDRREGRKEERGLVLTCADGTLHLNLLPLFLVQLPQTRLQDGNGSSLVHVLRPLVLASHNET